MRKLVTVDIEGTQYAIRQVGARAGSEMALRLMGFLSRLQAGDFEGVAKAIVEDGTYSRVLDAFAAETKITQPLTTGAAIQVALDFDEHFAGSYMALILWIKACFDLNFASFLGEMQKRFPDALAKVSGLSPQTGSTGVSGAS